MLLSTVWPRLFNGHASIAGSSMTDSISAPRRFGPSAALIVAGVAGVLLAATVALWAHYGSAVFYEMIVAGLAACF
jgi:hypothetical protein